MTPFIPDPEQAACTNSGGIWSAYPIPPGGPKPTSYCYYPPKDAGKQCYQKSDCEKDCVLIEGTDGIDKEGFLMGECGEYSSFNCIPTISFKTKDRKSKNLFQGGCV